MAFDSDNQPSKEDRKPRGKGRRTLMLDAIRAKYPEGGEHDFLQRVIEAAVGDEETKPNPTLLTMVLQRIEPPLKSTMPLVTFEFTEDATYSQKAAQIVKAISDGKLAPDVGAMIIGSIGSLVKIDEVTDLRNDVDAIKKMMGEQDG